MIKPRILILIAFLSTLIAINVSPIRAAVVTVTTATDEMMTNGLCSFREAISLVNAPATPNDCGGPLGAPPHTINFDASVENIIVNAGSPLPILTADQITIDGATGDINPPFGRTLTGTATAGSGLIIQGNNNQIIGLNFISFPGNGIVMTGANAFNNSLRDVGVGAVENDLNPAFGNGGTGILINNGAHTNTIGQLTASTVVANNQGNGIRIEGIGGATPPASETRNNTISSGVFIGVDPTLSFLAPNNVGVVVTNNATGNLIGTPVGVGINSVFILYNNVGGVRISDGANNNTVQFDLITDNTGIGVEVINAPNNFVQDNQIANNTIGIELEGATAISNTVQRNNPIQGHTIGVNVINGANNNVISTNVIQANATGVTLNNAGSNTVTSNNITGNTALGVSVTGGSVSNIITANTVSANPSGVSISGTGTSDNEVSANTITGNGIAGVIINGGAANNRVNLTNQINTNQNGVIITGAGTANNLVRANVIQGNTQDGVVINGNDGTTISNRITENSIFNNGTTVNDLGIDLIGVDGVNPNDPGDPDTGPNQLQNYPVLEAILTVTEYINTAPATSTRVRLDMDGTSLNTLEFFTNTAADTSGFGEGQAYQTSLTNVPNGLDQILTLPATLPVGSIVTSTATDAQNNTSEFSNALTVGELIPDFTWTPLTGIAPITINFTDATTLTTGTITAWAWDFQDDGIVDSTAQNPGFLYAVGGTYTVRLTVTHSSGITATVTDIITLTIPTPTLTPVPPTATFTTVPPTAIPPTATNVPPTAIPPTATNTDLPTNTLIPTNTATPLPTNTPFPTNTSTPIPTNTPVPTNTLIPTNTATPIPTNTPVPTNTPIPTNTVTPIPTNTIAPTLTATPSGDIEIDKRPDDDDTFTIIIENNGDDLEDVVVVEDLQDGVYYVSSVPGIPLCREAGGVISCTLGTIPSGGTATVQIDVDTEGVDIISGQTSVSTGGRTITTIDEPYITKLNQPPFAAPGDPLTYIIRVINPTSRTITNLTVRDTMPDAVEIESATASSGRVQVNGQNIVFTQASLAAGERITITLVGQLREGQTVPQIVNRACLTTSTTVRPRCAVAGFFKASQLPRTGESQRNLLMIGAGIAAVGVALVVILKRRGQTA